jgi:NAD-dependent deacetylase
MKKKLVISTGAGMSAESGIATFRDAGGLWERYPVMDVASADGFRRDPALIHRFYNARRREMFAAKPNAGHLGLAALESDFDVRIITQNVDNLHERACSSHVLHLHGELSKVRSMADESRLYELTPDDPDTSTDTRDRYGDPVRPHIVFFQEAVPNMEQAIDLAAEADIFVVIGTSLAVYPAASLIHYVKPATPVYYIDPNPAPLDRAVTVLRMGASQGVAELTRLLRGEK